MKPLVSIIVPVYNAEDYIETCVESIIRQTLSNIEIILVDDGSMDNSGFLCDQYEKKDSRVRVFHQNNSGVSVARNVGINGATADWIMFVDSDDWIELDAVEQAFSKIDNSTDLIILTFCSENISKCKILESEVCYYSMDDYRYDFLGRCRFNNIEYSPEKMQCNLRLTSQCAKIYRRELLISNNILFPVGIKDNEDGFFNFEVICKIKSALFYNYPVYHVRKRSDSASRRLTGRSQRIIKSLSVYDSVIQKHNLSKKLFRYQNIDIVLKTFLIVITYIHQNLNGEKKYRECLDLCKIDLKNMLCLRGIKHTNYKDIFGPVNKMVLLMLKMHCYDLVFLSFNIYYRIKSKRKSWSKHETT
ncbi:hypothetical protein SANA_29000 [Gottschalkiaceae bacterium SANA]|nr:hypothetical protein SANA_29000 [Gottschalkiaceae bacterium SANA]